MLDIHTLLSEHARYRMALEVIANEPALDTRKVARHALRPCKHSLPDPNDDIRALVQLLSRIPPQCPACGRWGETHEEECPLAATDPEEEPEARDPGVAEA